MYRIIISIAALSVMALARPAEPDSEQIMATITCMATSGMELAALEKFTKKMESKKPELDEKEFSMLGCLTKSMMMKDGKFDCKTASKSMGLSEEECKEVASEMEKMMSQSDHDVGKHMMEAMESAKRKR